MENRETVIEALDDFAKKPDSDFDIPPVLDQYLVRIAKTGETLIPWSKLKHLMVKKLDKSMEDFFSSCPTDELSPLPNVENIQYSEIKQRVLNRLKKFDGAPFTIQRLCELITQPKLHYKRTDKFIRGIEKNVMVVSTVDQYGNKIIVEPKTMVNGLDANGHSDESGLFTSPLPPIASPGLNAANWMSANFATNYPLHASTEEGTTSETSTNLLAEEEPDHDQDKPVSSEPETPSTSELDKDDSRVEEGEEEEKTEGKESPENSGESGDNLEELQVEERGDTVKLSLAHWPRSSPEKKEQRDEAAHWPQSSPEKMEQLDEEMGAGDNSRVEGSQNEATPDSSSFPTAPESEPIRNPESNEADSTNSTASDQNDQSQSSSEDSVSQSDSHSDQISSNQSSDNISSQSDDAIHRDMPKASQSESGSSDSSGECEEPPRKMQRTDCEETESVSVSLESSSENEETNVNSSEDQENLAEKNSEQLSDDVSSTSQTKEQDEPENIPEPMDTD